MQRISRSISAKLRLLLLVILLATSVLFSFSFYFVSMNIINTHVIPQYDQALMLGAQDVYKNMNTTQAMQTKQGGDSGRMGAETYLQQEVNKLNLQTAFLLDATEEQVVILARNPDSTYQVGDSFVAPEGIDLLAQSSEPQMSDIYSDQHGIHKSIFLGIPGSSLVLGVSVDYTAITSQISQILWICVGITLSTLIVGWLASTWVIGRLTRPLADLAKLSEQIALGDLTHDIRVKGEDEIAQLAKSFHSMTQNLKQMIRQVLTASSSVVTGSNTLFERVNSMNGLVKESTVAADEVFNGSSSIATAASENARAMEEITQGIQHIAESAGHVSEQISKATAEAVNGNQLAQDAMSQMIHVSQATEESTQFVRTLKERSEAVGQVVSSIFEITQQIQMLSLNASIEAARAGEHGRGFAVVAGEVRKLAEQSKTAMEEINDYLSSVKEDSERSVDSMIKVREEVQSGSQVVQQAGTAFGELLELIKNINSTIQSVSAAAQQVSAGSEEVSASVEETAQITGKSQQMVTNIRETAENQLEHMESHSATVGELHEQAKTLQEAVRKFKI